jgi:hypothetical protein
MKQTFQRTLLLFFLLSTLAGCRDKLEQKGFAVSPPDGNEETVDGISEDSVRFPTRPSNILLTGIPKYRLATVYKVNFNKDSTTFIGENDFHFNYGYDESDGNQWHGNYLPGLEAVSGYNLVNVSLYNTETRTQKTFFEKPVLIKTLYYPSLSKDTLNFQPVARNYYMISVFDEDTNKDGYINVHDLRRLYSFDIDAGSRKPIIPTNYSVYKSEYDHANDIIYIFAKLDENKNGKIDELEPVGVFWIDLKNPQNVGRQY